jgi:gamma-glutamyltranspeptidase/glutathione hydrolase
MTRWLRIGLLLLVTALAACTTAKPSVSREPPPLAPAGSHRFDHAAVAADHPVASAAGAEILRRGGNAVDAAVATSFALSVVRPMSCGIGGGGFMVIHLPDHPRHDGPVTVAINYRETAPAAITPDHFERLDDPHASTRGGHAVAVPGTVAGLLLALDRYGTMDRRTVLGPAIDAAENGFTVDAYYAEEARALIAEFERTPEYKDRFPFVWQRFLREGRVREGDTIRLPEQAAALRLIAEHGADAFYRGPIADAIAAAVARDGGMLTASDLATYTPAVVPPLRFSALGGTYLTIPPPSSGGVALGQIMGILQLRRSTLLASPGRWNPDAIHSVVEAMKHAFADRAEWMADPAFNDVPVERLLSPDYLAQRAALFDPRRTHPPALYGTRAPPPPDDSGTSHLCVVDARGGAVACTETINLAFGSLLAVPEFGFVLNNEMDDFTTRRGVPNDFGLVQSPRNMPRPGMRPLSSMTPTILLDDAGRVRLVAGASGGPRIISATALAILNVVLYDDSAAVALARPRFHHQWQPDILFMEPPFFTPGPTPDAPGIAAEMAARGHEVRRRNGIAAVQLIRRTRDQLQWDAASDPRKGGRPAGF